MDKLRAMSVFVKIAEKGTLTAAAEELATSLPSVVRTLAALEESLHVRLFNRTTRRIVLTREGEIYLAQCRRILTDIADAEAALTQEQSEPIGKITVTAPVRFGEMHVAPAITKFINEFPQLEVNLLLLDRVVDLFEEGIDLAVRIAPLEDSSLIARPVGHVRQLLCASPRLISAVGTPSHPSELTKYPCVRFTGISAGSVWRFRSADESIAVHVAGRFSSNQVGATVNGCVAGLGFGLFLSYQVLPWLRSGELVTVLADFEPAPTPLSLVYPHARLLSSRVRTLVDWLAEPLAAALETTPGKSPPRRNRPRDAGI
jgi:DNA-binding transcriptional LysR family regulator